MTDEANENEQPYDITMQGVMDRDPDVALFLTFLVVMLRRWNKVVGGFPVISDDECEEVAPSTRLILTPVVMDDKGEATALEFSVDG